MTSQVGVGSNISDHHFPSLAYIFNGGCAHVRSSADAPGRSLTSEHSTQFDDRARSYFHICGPVNLYGWVQTQLFLGRNPIVFRPTFTSSGGGLLLYPPYECIMTAESWWS